VCIAPGTRQSSFGPIVARNILSECRQGSTTSAPSQISSSGNALAAADFSGETSLAGKPANRSPRKISVQAPGAKSVLPSSGQRCNPA